MKITTTKARPLIPTGEQLLCLISVEVKVLSNLFKESPSDPDEVERLLWQFQSKATDPDTGEPYEYGIFTNLNYGHARAGITKLLDQLVPGITIDIADQLDTDDLCNKWYRARIKHVKNAQGVDKAEHTMIEPYAGKASTAAKSTPAPPPDEPEKPVAGDPFADS